MRDICYEPVTVKGSLVFITRFPELPALSKPVNVLTLDNGVKAIECEIAHYNADGSFNYLLPV